MGSFGTAGYLGGERWSAMEMLLGVGAVWVAAAAAVTFGLAHAAAAQPFHFEGDPHPLSPVTR
jgi:hypothetical protein